MQFRQAGGRPGLMQSDQARTPRGRFSTLASTQRAEIMMMGLCSALMSLLAPLGSPSRARSSVLRWQPLGFLVPVARGMKGPRNLGLGAGL